MARQAGGDDVRIDVDTTVTQLTSLMASNNLSMSPRCCIFRVPNTLLKHNPIAYTPTAFSIGPFYYDEPHLKATQKIKLKYLLGLITRFPNADPEILLRNLTSAISEVSEEALECYEGSLDMRMDEFVMILVLDGCFLIELFRKAFDMNLREEDDPIFSTSSMSEVLYHDLILLGNQIPWLVLQLLFDHTMISTHNVTPLKVLVTNFFFDIFSRSITIFDQEGLRLYFSEERENSRHILDLLRNSMVSSSSIRSNYLEYGVSTDWQPMPSATSLWQAGIKFKKARTASILDIKFENGVLEIPQIQINEMTESLLRNLICLEQCLPNCEGVITSYAILLDYLVKTPKDMEILCQYDVIYNLLDIEDTTYFLNQLCLDTVERDFHYVRLSHDVNKYCRRRWPRYRRMLKRDYFNYPGAFISITVAAILFMLTYLQTLFSIIDFFSNIK